MWSFLVRRVFARKHTPTDARRENLNQMVVFDHDVIDGAPAARFTRRLVELIESGYGLEDQTMAAIDTEQI